MAVALLAHAGDAIPPCRLAPFEERGALTAPRAAHPTGLAALLTLLAATLSACTPPDGAGCALQLAAVLPLQPAAGGNRLVTRAIVDGQDVTLLVDTGAEATLLDQRLVRLVEHTGLGGFMSGFGGSRAIEVARVRQLQLGTLKGSVTAMVARLDPDLVKAGLDGVLGMDILGAYDDDFDLADHQLRLFVATGTCDAPHVALTGATFVLPRLANSAHAVCSKFLPPAPRRHWHRPRRRPEANLCRA